MKKKLLYLIAILLMAYFPLFLHLESIPCMVWDESRLAVSAFEMLQNHNPWVVTYGNAPDLWSVKPPLMIWVLSLSFKLLGYNLLALRLPSAIFGLITLWVVHRFCEQDLKSKQLAFLATFVLLTSWGYMDYHVTRTGDYDALLILFQVLFIVYFIKHHFQLSNKVNKNLYISAFFLSLALFTKGVAALFFCPGLLFFLFIEEKWKHYYSSRSTYIACLIAFLPCLLYLLWREHLASGYLKAVWEMEFVNRYLYGDSDPIIIKQTLLERLEYYWSSMYEVDFKPWIYFLPIGILTIYKKEKTQCKILQYLLCITFFFMLLISLSSSKKGWYEAPVYPYLAILVGIGLEELSKNFYTIFAKQRHKGTRYGLLGVFFIFFTIPYIQIFKKFYRNTDLVYGWQERQYTPMMLKSSHEKPFYVLQTTYNSAVQFTQNVLNEQPPNKIYTINVRDTQYFPKALKIGDKLLYCASSEKDSIEKYFTYVVLDTYRMCKFVKLINCK